MSEKDTFDSTMGFHVPTDEEMEKMQGDDWFVDMVFLILLSVIMGLSIKDDSIKSLDDLKDRIAKVNDKFQNLELPKEVKGDED